jgi:hypothetical protein
MNYSYVTIENTMAGIPLDMPLNAEDDIRRAL